MLFFPLRRLEALGTGSFSIGKKRTLVPEGKCEMHVHDFLSFRKTFFEV